MVVEIRVRRIVGVINDDAAKVVVDVFEEYVKDGATLKSTAFGYYCQVW